MATDEISDFINSNAGNSAPSFKFKNIGDKLVGTVKRRAVVETKDLNDASKKVKNLVLDIEDADGELHSLWIKPSQLLSALAGALKETNAVPGSPLVGDRLGVEFTDTEAPKQAHHSPKKIFKVSFRQGEANRPSEPNSVDDLL